MMQFEEIYNAFWPKIFRLCMGYVNDHALAQDLTQESFVIVWQQLSKFRNESAIGTWIFRIASNNCLRQIEREGRMAKGEMPMDLPEEKSVSLEPQIRLLYQYISELPEIDRIIISLELEDVKQSEIAAITGLTEANVRVKIHRIKDKLTEKFERNGR